MVRMVETHTPSSRGILNKYRLEDVTLDVWNGEDVFYCDPLVREAVGLYFSEKQIIGNKEGHFIRNEYINYFIIQF